MSPDSRDELGRRLGDEVRFGVLGPVAVTDGTSELKIGGPKQRTVLAVLIANSGDPVSIDMIIDAVWGEEAASNAKRIAQTYVATLRSVVGDAILKSGSGWHLDVDRSEIDAIEFEDLYESAREALDSNPQRASVALREALAIWRGIPYSGVEAHGALEGEVARLSELRIAAQAARIEADLALGRDADLVGEIEALMADHPYSERLRAHHMLALYRAGRQKEALHSYDQMRTVLVEELGVDPTPDLQDLEHKILTQDDSLRVTATQTIKRRAILVADPGDPIEIGHFPADKRDRLLRRSSEALRATIDGVGDGLCVTAGTTTYVIVEDALTAAHIAEMVTRRLHGEGLRVAIDWGDILLKDDRVSGPPVSRAAVMAAVAHKGQVLLSVDAHQAIAASGNGRGLRFENLGRYHLHGVEEGLVIFQLLVGDLPQVFPDLEIHRLPPPLPGGGDRSVPGYELREPLVPGSVGTLYRAFRPSLGREVLIEVIDRAESVRPGFIRSFEADAQRLSLLDHQSIAQVIDYWRQPDGAFIVYRFPRGGLLSGERIDDPSKLIDQLGSALVYAHSLGMVHGSVTPDRVALDEARNASLLCFPVAGVEPVVVDEYQDYVAPEIQAGGSPTPQTDLYALGVLSRSHGLSDHPAVERATLPDPNNRHASVADFLVELNPIGADSPAARYTEVRNPYKGLAAFREKDAGDFYGRIAAVDELVVALEQSHLLALVGPSGVGKSSVVRAGLIPELRAGRIDGSERWLVTDMLPGSHPFLDLQRALERVAVDLPVGLTEKLADHDPLALATISSALPEATELVVLVDQFEELFTLVSENERRSFLDLIEAAVEGHSARFLLTLRADFLDRPLRHSTFGKRLKESTVMLSSPTQDELATAVVQPARGVGVDVAPELVERLVSDVYDQPGALPLLQHALTELFGSRSSDLLGLTDFQEVGGVSGSVARRAETTHGGLTAVEQARARQVFLRLVTIVDDSAPSRRRVRLADLEDLGAGVAIEAFAKSRLLVLDNDPETRSPTVEVAHEALLTHWPRLAAWIEAAREDLALSRRLDEARREWLEGRQDAAYLLTGGRLAQHETWSSSTSLLLSQAQREYLEASRRHDQRLKTRSRQRRNWITAGFAAAGAIAVVFAFTASKSATQAQAESWASNAVVALESDPQLTVLLSVAAMQLDPSLAATSALHQGLQSDRMTQVIPPPDGSDGAHAVVDPGGSRVAIMGIGSSRLQQWEIGASTPSWDVMLSGGDSAFFLWSQFWYSRDGSRIYVPISSEQGGDDAGIYTVDTQAGEIVSFLPFRCIGRIVPAGGTFATDGAPFAADWVEVDANGNCGDDFRAGVLDIASGETLFQTPTFGAGTPPSLSADGQYLAANGCWPDCEPERTKVFDVRTGEVVFDHPQVRASGVLSADGERILVDSDPAYLYDVATRERLQTYQSTTGRKWFSEDENLVVATDVGGAVRVFDTESGKDLITLRGHTDSARSPSIDTSNAVVVSSGFDAARIWDVSALARGDLAPIKLAESETEHLYIDALSEVGGYVLVRRGQITQLPPSSTAPHVAEVMSGEDVIWRAEAMAASLGPDGLLAVQPVLERGVSAPDGDFEAMVGKPYVYDVSTARRVAELEGCDWYWDWWTIGPSPVAASACDETPLEFRFFEFSDDGTTLIGVDWFGAVRIWDVASGQVIDDRNPSLEAIRLTLEGSRWAATISPDGQFLVEPPTGEDWDIAARNRTFPEMTVEDLTSGRVVGRFPIDTWVDHLEWVPDSNRLVGAHADLVLIDTEDWSVRTFSRAQGARINDMSLSPNDELVATIGFDNFLVVWSVEDGRIVAEIPVLGDVGETLRGVAFLDNETIAVAPELGGELLVFTLDHERLVEEAIETLDRGFTEGECLTYEISPCPTLEEMQPGRSN